MKKEIINIEHVPSFIRNSIANRNEEDDWEAMAEYFEIDEEDNWERLIADMLEEQSMEGRFAELTNLVFIQVTEELGDIDKAYWSKQALFQRLTDGKFFAAEYDESDHGYWGGFHEVKELREVERKERIEVYYE